MQIRHSPKPATVSESGCYSQSLQEFVCGKIAEVDHRLRCICEPNVPITAPPAQKWSGQAFLQVVFAIFSGASRDQVP